MMRNTLRLALPLALAAAACSDSPTSGSSHGLPNTDRPLGATSFVSADGGQNAASPGSRAGSATNAPTAGADNSGTRTVEEGDIYHVVTPGLLANLNPYRGLQLIDFTDVAAPRVLGRYQIAGAPVEM